eukprot:gene20280-22266_t
MFDGEEVNELDGNKSTEEEGNVVSFSTEDNEDTQKPESIELGALPKTDQLTEVDNDNDKTVDNDKAVQTENVQTNETVAETEAHFDANSLVKTKTSDNDQESSAKGKLKETEDKEKNEALSASHEMLSSSSSSSSESSSSSSNSSAGREEVVIVDVHKAAKKQKDGSDGVAFSLSSPSKSAKWGFAKVCSVEEYNGENFAVVAEEDNPEHAETTADSANCNDELVSADDATKSELPHQTSFPLCLWRLVESESDSSCKSNEFESSLSKENLNEMEYSTNNHHQQHLHQHHHQYSLNRNGATSMDVKSENTLASKLLNAEINGEDSQEKAVSLSILEASSSNNPHDVEATNRLYSTGTRPKNNQAVWFSLPEMEKSDDKPMQSDQHSMSTERTSGDSSHWSLKQLDGGSKESEDNVEEDGKKKEISKHDADSDTPRDFVEELLDHRKLRRRGATRQSFRETTRDRGSLRQRRQRLSTESVDSSLLGQDEDNPENNDRHMALTHDDTTTGAVHCYKDEYGLWHTYVFGDETTADRPLPSASQRSAVSNSFLRDLRRARSGSTPASLTDRDLFESVSQDMRLSQLFPGGLESRTSTDPLSQLASPGSFKVSEPPPRRFYKLHLNENFFIKVWFDRLALLALLDRNKTTVEVLIAIIFGGLTAFLGYMLLSRSYFYDLWIFVFCFVIAKCQFSLLKSVQPDSASPVHGYNNVIVFSRAAYFCLVSSMILILDEASKVNSTSLVVYGISLFSKQTLEFGRDMLIVFVLIFPLIFVFGLLPQINTFTMYILEQLDVHVFGGTAMTSVVGSIYSFFRSVISVLILYAICFGSMKKSSDPQNIHFSIFCGVLVGFCYHLSRCASDPFVLWDIFKSKILRLKLNDEEGDPLPGKLRKTVLNRVGNDIIVLPGIVIVVFAVHVSTVFTSLQPTLSYTFYILTAVVGVFNHYLVPQLRKQLPWLLGSSPVLKSEEYFLFETLVAAKIMWFEKMYVWLFTIEKNILYPLTFLSGITRFAGVINNKFGLYFGPMVITITAIKLFRSNFTSTQRQHVILIWTVLFFEFDFRGHSETFPIDYFIMSIFVDKAIDLLLKFRFILTYTAPWQITWGSAFHAFAQPFSVPHCGMLFLQATISAFFSAPLNPFLGSAIFLTSYVRPTKFWEKNYNTKRADHSNTRLSSHLDNNPCSDDNNLNSIFYEHLTRSLQHSLCGDILMGRWGNVSSGDFFVIASDYLNALVHVIEVGNGFVTFQLRGLEFRGTYCQQRELEAITEWVDSDERCCCCSPICHFDGMLSCKAAFNKRWLAWEVIQTKYTIEGYSVSDNTATSMFQVFDLRKIFITYYVKAIIYFAVGSVRLTSWLSDSSLMSLLSETKTKGFVDLDAVFRAMTDEDYDVRFGGISRVSFCNTYFDWIEHCNHQNQQPIQGLDTNSDLVTLCFALSLLGRRMFFTASHQPATTLKTFLHGLHSLFKGDFRVSSPKDEWVFAEPDMELLRKVISPAVRMSVKLHQDHFTCPDEYDENTVLYEAIKSHNENLVISHEGDPKWRQAVLNNKSSLLALRYVMDEGDDDYKIIMLNKRYLSFRVVKVNRECVRGLWAGQLQELIFLRNRNPERGSIQNAKQALRNMINSSCDQPIGYPIYVSPLTTSYADTNDQFTQIVGGPVSLNVVSKLASSVYRRLRQRYGGACNPSTSADVEEIELPALTVHQYRMETPRDAKVVPSQKAVIRASSTRTSYTAVPNVSRRSSSSTSAAVVPVQQQSSKQVSFELHKVRIKNPSLTLYALNAEDGELEWPSEEIKEKSKHKNWPDNWEPTEGLVGEVAHRWDSKHSDSKHRSFYDSPILLIKLQGMYVPILENGVTYLSEIDV